MNKDASKVELSRLAGYACDSVITEGQRIRLNELLLDIPAARVQYLRYIAIHSALTTTAGNQTSRRLEELCDQLKVTGDLPSHQGLTLRSWLVSSPPLLRAAVILFVLVPVAYFVGRWIAPAGNPMGQMAVPQMAAGPVVRTDETATLEPGIATRLQGKARVSRVAPETRWPRPNESYTVDSIVRTGSRLRFLEGEMELVYESGAKLLLIGPIDFVLREGGGELLRGGLMASVPQAGHGFTIETPNGKVVDLGTEFGLMVDDFGVSEVSVFEGKVEAFPASNSPHRGKIRLTEGSALQWNKEMVKSLEANPRRLPVTLASYSQPGNDQLETRAVLSDDFRDQHVDSRKWIALGEIRMSPAGILMKDSVNSRQVPYLVSKDRFDPMIGPVTVICELRFPHVAPDVFPSFSILTRCESDRTALDRAWSDVLATCVRCNFRSATDEVDGLLETSTKYERDRELTSLSWRGFRRPQQDVLYRLVMRDDGVNVSFTVTQVDKPSVTKTVVCRSLFQGYENHIALEGWDRGSVIVEKLRVYQQPSRDNLADHFARFAFASDSEDEAASAAATNPLRTRISNRARLVLADDFEDPRLNDDSWSVLGEATVAEGNASLGRSRVDDHIDTFHPRPYLLTRKSFTPVNEKVFVLGKIEFDDNYLQGYGGSFAIMSRCSDRYGVGPEWAVSALSTGIRCNLWPAAPQADHNLEIHEKSTAEAITFLKGGSLDINPRSRSYYFLMEDSGNDASITFQDTVDPTINGSIRHETSPDAPRSGFIGFESTWGSRVLLDDVQIYVLDPGADEEQL